MRWFLSLACLSLCAGCATVEHYTHTKTYVISAAQVEQVKRDWHIEACPAGTQAAALTVESSTGGALVTVRCQ